MTVIGYSLASRIARRLPRGASDAIADFLADCYVWTHPARASAVEQNLTRICSVTERGFPMPRAHDTYRAFARAVCDFLAQDPASAGRAPSVRLAPGAHRALDAARAAGRGTVLLSGHFGPWERALQWLASELGGVDALTARHRSEAVERFFESRRAAFGIRTLCSSRPVATALKTLKKGGWIAALADRPRRDVCPWPFAPGVGDSGPAAGIVPIDPGPLLLARRAGAVVLPGAAALAPDDVLEVRFQTPFSLAPEQGGLTLQGAAARVQGFFDDHVRAYPTQWFQWRSDFSVPSQE